MADMKKVLMVSTVMPTIAHANMSNINILIDLGYQVDVACDYWDVRIWPKSEAKKFRKKIIDMGGKVYQIGFSRNPLNIVSHIKSLYRMLILLKKEKYDFIHTHTPIASAIVRIAAHWTNTKVIYTAHGFHFFKGAPVQNWFIYYPIEKILSRWTDMLITINHEDYRCAKKKFYAKTIRYIPGIGIDIEKFRITPNKLLQKKEELKIDQKDFLLLSVGELNNNKNHEIVIRTMAKLKEYDVFEKIHYVICGEGEKKEFLNTLADSFGIASHVHMLGFRDDVADIYGCADAFIFMSKREGLPVSLMEAMAAGLPIICSNIRGNNDLVRNGIEGLFSDFDTKLIAEKILMLINDKKLRYDLGANARKRVKNFDIKKVNKNMSEIYLEVAREI